MSRASLLVYYHVTESQDRITSFALDLAEKLDADVIGAAACAPVYPAYADGFDTGEVIAEDRRRIDADLDALGRRFHAEFGRRALDWRSSTEYRPAAIWVAEQSRAADLVATSTVSRGIVFGDDRQLNLGDLVMWAGRPVLIAPPGAHSIDLDCAVVAWKDTREARRAAADALPLLALAKRIIVVEIASPEGLPDAASRVADVGGWLSRHGIAAETRAVPSVGDDSGQLDTLTGEYGAGLLVAGAYGHSRLREWALGGVTHDLLLQPSRPVLVSR
jgi:nucleotide-binding universal stress UspA family protein